MQGITGEASFFKHKGSVVYSTHYKCIKTVDQNFNWDDFKKNYDLIILPLELKTYAIKTYTDLSKFLVSWDKFRKFKFIPFMGVECTPPTCWRLGLGGLKAQ
jgi:hypothetical protein